VGTSPTSGSHSRLVIHVDGGSRGNPGPAAIGVVLSAPDGTTVDELGERIGVATNNVAEYQALLRGVQHAAQLGAREIELVNDSELVAKQLTGAYKVKHPAMRPLHAEAIEALNSTAGGSARCRAPRTRAPTRSSTRRWTVCDDPRGRRDRLRRG